MIAVLATSSLLALFVLVLWKLQADAPREDRDRLLACPMGLQTFCPYCDGPVSLRQGARYCLGGERAQQAAGGGKLWPVCPEGIGHWHQACGVCERTWTAQAVSAP